MAGMLRKEHTASAQMTTKRRETAAPTPTLRAMPLSIRSLNSITRKILKEAWELLLWVDIFTEVPQCLTWTANTSLAFSHKPKKELRTGRCTWPLLQPAACGHLILSLSRTNLITWAC